MDLQSLQYQMWLAVKRHQVRIWWKGVGKNGKIKCVQSWGIDCRVCCCRFIMLGFYGFMTSIPCVWLCGHDCYGVYGFVWVLCLLFDCCGVWECCVLCVYVCVSLPPLLSLRPLEVFLICAYLRSLIIGKVVILPLPAYLSLVNPFTFSLPLLIFHITLFFIITSLSFIAWGEIMKDLGNKRE